MGVLISVFQMISSQNCLLLLHSLIQTAPAFFFNPPQVDGNVVQWTFGFALAELFNRYPLPAPSTCTSNGSAPTVSEEAFDSQSENCATSAVKEIEIGIDGAPLSETETETENVSWTDESLPTAQPADMRSGIANATPLHSQSSLSNYYGLGILFSFRWWVHLCPAYLPHICCFNDCVNAYIFTVNKVCVVRQSNLLSLNSSTSFS